MTTAADVIAALNQRRQRKSLRPEEPGTLPAGWQSWLDAQPAIDAQAPGSPAPSWVAAFVERPLRPIPRSPKTLNRWQAFSTLWQQNWLPNLREERGLRIGVTTFDIVLHIVLVGLLLWLMYLRFMAMAQQEEETEAVQVEFIGRGNVEEGGGALANAGADSAPAAASASSSRAAQPAPSAGQPDAAASIEQVSMPQPQPLAAEVQLPQRERALAPPVAAPEAAQPLQVSEVPTPEPQSFQLPPPRERTVAMPQPQLREPQPVEQVEEVATLQPQQVRALQPSQRAAQVRVPELRDQPQALDVPAPQRMQAIRERAAPAATARQAQLQVPELRGQVRDIPLPPGGAPSPSGQPGAGTAANATATAPGAGGKSGTSNAAGQALAGTGQGVRAADNGGRGVTSAGTGAGPGSKPAPGGWPGAAKSDDWGASNRNVAGTGNGRNGDGKSGVFNDDGSVRLPDEWTQQTGVNLDRSGTWLKRPGLEYRGTRFDQYWIPQGNLLEEWVRRGIKKVAIPIPGTNTRLECVVSLLQLGGGCFPVNPDINEQPARPRKAPEIPFKPQLQEDNGSLRPQDAPAQPAPPAGG